MNEDNPKRDRDLIARAVVIEDGRLLVNRDTNAKTGQSYCALPGGHIDPGESAPQALAREFVEELEGDLEVGDLCFVSEQIYPGRRAKETRRHELTLLFRGELKHPLREANGRVFSPEPRKNFGWLPLAELPGANLRPAAISRFLEQDLAGKSPCRYEFEDTTQ